jgi:hypothetical protein
MGGGTILQCSMIHSDSVSGGTKSRLQKWVFLIMTYIDSCRHGPGALSGSRWPRSVGGCPWPGAVWSHGGSML